MISTANYAFRNPRLANEARRREQKLAEFSYADSYVKEATIGGDQETEFENALASLAFTHVKDKAPRLLDYMVGFQLVDRNDDNTKAVGIFGFEVGGQWVYAPVFFLNGKMKGHELMYLKSQDIFVPLKENWVNYITSKTPHVLGEPGPRSLSEWGVLQPDIRELSTFPGYSNKASSMRKWAADFLPTLAGWATQNPWEMEKYAGLDDRLNLPKLLRESLSLTKVAVDSCQRYPQIDRMIRKHYGENVLRDALLDLRQQVTKAGSAAILGDNPEPTRISILHGEQPIKHAAPAVEVVAADTLFPETGTQMTESERERLLRDGYLIRDHRDGDEVSKAYNTQIDMDLSNPDASGLYDVLVRPGEFQEHVVIAQPHTSSGRCHFCTVLKRSSPRGWLNAHRTTVWSRPNTSPREDWEKWYEQAESVTPKKGGIYIAVSYCGEGSTPFRVREEYADGRYEVSFLDYADTSRPNYLPATDTAYRDDIDANFHAVEMLHLNDREGSRFKSLQGALYVPKDHKILSVEEVEKDEDEGGGEPVDSLSSQSKNAPIELGTLADIQTHIVQKTAQLRILVDNQDCSINRGEMVPVKSALFSLVTEHGFREKTARKLIKESQRARLKGKAGEFYVLYGDNYPFREKQSQGGRLIGMGPGAPAIPAQEFGSGGPFGNVPTATPQEDLIGVAGLESANTDPSVYDTSPEALPDPMSMQIAQQADQSGQKEVFDTAMISGLLKSVRHDSLVDRYMGDLLKALDRLGRVLFMFYWHNEEFTDRYGKAEMPELEDTLRNAFEVMGDLILFLREKNVEPLPGVGRGDPEITDAARN